MAVDIVPTKLDGTDLRIGIVVARFNEYAGRGEFESCMDELRKLGVMEEDVTKVSVPGALEIPFALQKLAQTGEYDALIALGAVIRGETYHFELVSNESGAAAHRAGLRHSHRQRRADDGKRRAVRGTHRHEGPRLRTLRR